MSISCSTNCSTCTAEIRENAFDKIKNKIKAIEDFEYEYETHSKPTSLIMGITTRCNLSCPYCFVNQGTEDMTLEIAQKAVDWVVNNCKENTQPFINFFGGEPLLLFDEIIKPLVENNPNVLFGITTNGTLLDEDKVDFLYKNKVQPLLSFDGIELVQNNQRPGKGFDSFELVLKNIPYLLLRLPNTIMRATITKDSIPFLYDIVLMAEALGFKEITFCPNAYEDWNKENEFELFNQFNKIGLYIYKELRKNNYNTIRVNPINKYFSAMDLGRKDELKFNNRIMRCGLGTTTCGITPKGEIVPCQEKISNPNIILGDIYNGINKEIHKNYLINYFNNINSLKCNLGCSDRDKSICLSDICPSRLEDLNYNFSTSYCAFIRQSSKISARLHYLCSNSIFPHIRDYFKQGEYKNEFN